MNRDEYLLTCLIEECVEVAHRASKALRFGLNEVQVEQPKRRPNDGKTNEERLADELGDLFAIVEMLEDLGFKRTDTVLTRTMKQDKVRRYMDYSRTKGTLHDVDPPKTS